jgi:hypothetical protein
LFASLMTIYGVVSADSGRLCLAPDVEYLFEYLGS